MDQQIVQANQTLLKLKADIVLAEKEKKKALDDLDQLQSIKTQAYKKYNTENTLQQNKIKVLTKTVGDLKSMADDLEAVIKSKKDELKDFGKEEIKAANDSLKVIHGDIEIIKREIKDREENIASEKEYLNKSHRDMDIKIQELQTLKFELELREGEIQKEKDRLGEAEQQSKEAVAKNRELLDDINRELKEKRMQVINLDVAIESKTKQAESVGVDANARLAEAEHLEKLVLGKENALNDKNIELIKKERWLSDREASLRRAYLETVHRGGKVDE